MAEKSSIASAIFWMCLIGLLLCWLQFFGPLIAGFVGGKKAGSVGNALAAVFLPCILVGAAVFVFFTMVSFNPLVGLVASVGITMLIVLNIGSLLLGAIIGGAVV